MDCLFCQQAVKDKAIAQYSHVYVKEDSYPVSKGHLLIIPNVHTENWFTATREVREEILIVIEEMKVLLDQKYAPDGYNIGMNCGVAAGQTVMHLHVHLIPRYEGDIDNPRGGVRGVIPSKQKY